MNCFLLYPARLLVLVALFSVLISPLGCVLPNLDPADFLTSANVESDANDEDSDDEDSDEPDAESCASANRACDFSANASCCAGLVCTKASETLATCVEPEPEPEPEPLNLCELQKAFFATRCTGCHTSGSMLDLSPAGIFSSLVETPSPLYGNQMRVVPFQPEASLLLAKLTSPPAGMGERMPIGGEATAEEIELVRSWIAAGAPSDCEMPESVCREDGDYCSDAPCCGDLICVGKAWSYGQGFCGQPLELDTFCIENAECASGACINDVCATPTCAAAEDSCYGDAACCEGFCALPGDNGYGPGQCSPLLGDDEVCVWGGQCASGFCTIEQLCSSSCSIAGGACGSFANPPCCDGTVCVGEGPYAEYAEGSCTVPMSAGNFCIFGDECLSGVCANDLCI